MYLDLESKNDSIHFSDIFCCDVHKQKTVSMCLKNIVWHVAEKEVILYVVVNKKQEFVAVFETLPQALYLCSLRGWHIDYQH